jgi:uncharacterized protein (UPF0276 family)
VTAATGSAFAVNYSALAVKLHGEGKIPTDRFKCPAWPDLIDRIDGEAPVYIHFPLRVGAGRGHPINTETDAPPDYDEIEVLMARTGTPWVSAHMGPKPEDVALLASGASVDGAAITGALIRDLAPLVARFGPERVVAENVFTYYGQHLRPALLPEVIHAVVEATGCGLLLDLSHARLAARDLGLDARAYIEALPVDRIREIHVTGIQVFDEAWVAKVKAAGLGHDAYAIFEHKAIDHLPMTGESWELFAWAIDRIQTGAWATPGLIAFEYGGVGAFFEAVLEREVLLAQVPRLYEMVHA